MLVSWKYKERNSLIQKLDPRSRFIFTFAMLFSLIYFWDLRYLLVFAGIAVIHFIMTRVTLRESRVAWFILFPVIIMLIIFTFLTGRSGAGVYETDTLITQWKVWFLTIDVTVEKTTFALAQAIRLPTMALLAMVIPYTINPAHYGVAFRGLGIPDKFAYAMDLAFRLVPTVGRDFSITYDAQRARGYELEKVKGGLLGLVRRISPLLIPVVIQTIISGEEVSDAMDLRAFGVGPRTWLTKLEYSPIDRVVIALSILIFLGSTVLSLRGYGSFWVPEFIMKLAGG